MLNGLPSVPMRDWRKNTGPPSSIRMASAAASRIGDRATRASTAPTSRRALGRVPSAIPSAQMRGMQRRVQ